MLQKFGQVFTYVGGRDSDTEMKRVVRTKKAVRLTITTASKKKGLKKVVA